MSARSDVPLLLTLMLLLICDAGHARPSGASASTLATAPTPAPTPTPNRAPAAVSAEAQAVAASSGFAAAPTPDGRSEATAHAVAQAAAQTGAQPAAPSGAGAPARTDVYVLATLYTRHAKTPAYDLAALRQTILAIRPQVLVVDCTPEEVKARKVSPGKIEYPGVIFPLADEGGYPIYPAEPGEPLFTEIVEKVSAVRKQVAAEQPALAEALNAYDAGTYTVLAKHWTSPAAVHDEVTESAVRGLTVIEREFYGTRDGDAQVRWNRHWTDAILRAVAAHPGQRVLAVTGLENRPWIVDALRSDPRVHVVDMPAWLRAHAAPGAPAASR